MYIQERADGVICIYCGVFLLRTQAFQIDVISFVVCSPNTQRIESSKVILFPVKCLESDCFVHLPGRKKTINALAHQKCMTPFVQERAVMLVILRYKEMIRVE